MRYFAKNSRPSAKCATYCTAWTLLSLLTCALLPVDAQKLGKGGGVAMERFERYVRPILLEKCQSCHGDSQAQGGLRLNSREGALKGGGRGVAIALGKPEQSLLIKAIEHHGELKMPPSGKLTRIEIAYLKQWIAEGSPWGASNPTTKPNGAFRVTNAQRNWWAFQPVRAGLPLWKGERATVASPIDQLIRKKQKSQGIIPAKPADRRTLIRRVTFDLTGLPPTPEQVDAFLQDRSPNAFEKVADRLLATPDYGVRFARHWLDVVRYADYHDGNPKARTASCEPLNAWRYRDWVVSAFNRDLPFDQFIVHQIAGDLLPSPNNQEFYADGLVATTFLTNGSWDRGDADKEKMVSDMVDDQIDTIGKAFLGLTLGCARCHDHKFDPISQSDYYGLAGMFYSTHILQDIGAKGAEYTLNRIPLAPKAYVEKRALQQKRIAELVAKLAELDKRTPKPAPDDSERVALVKHREQAEKELLPEPALAEAAQDGGTTGGLFPNIQDVPIHIRGSYTRLGSVVKRHLPVFFAGDAQPPNFKGSGRREFAAWIASKNNPLTARVIVNRVWQWHFGTGLVQTPNNFGLLSPPASHPELLDWLAAQFIADGWSLKKLHRRIILTNTYQQSSVSSRTEVARDPENRWLGRYPARRLEAESLRDAMLAVNGTLESHREGPATADLSQPCRSLYVQTARWDRGSFAILFDAANPDASEERRNVSVVAPQALFLLNNDFALNQAQRLAERLTRDVPAEETARIQYAYRLLFSRSASLEEVALCKRFLAQASTRRVENPWRNLAHALLCSNEFTYLD